MSGIFWKGIIPTNLQDPARKALNNCDIEQFFSYASNEYSLTLLSGIIGDAHACGKLESAFIYAYAATRTNNYHAYETIENILEYIDHERLQEQGDKLPEQNEYRLYRGVSGDDSPEIIKGYSWTSNLEIAHWFAMRYSELGNPSVYTTTVGRDAILFYTNERSEDEFVLNPNCIVVDFLTVADQAIAEIVESLKV